MEKQMMNLEVIWWLNKGHNVSMDIIRYIISEWIYYPAIEDNEQFRECLKLWFDKTKEKQEERNNMIKKYGHISDWNTKNITNMSKIFYSKIMFNEDISRWDVSNVTNMSHMFAFCSTFTCDLSQWNVSNVKDMSNMFNNCTNFNCNLSQWNVSNVTNMSSMFNNCNKFKSDISQWNVHNVKDFSNMFNHCNNLSNLSMILVQWNKINSNL